jgi:hypothetical protein
LSCPGTEPPETASLLKQAGALEAISVSGALSCKNA